MDDIKKKKEEIVDETTKSIDEIEVLKKEVEDYKNKYLRAIADYRNFERRVQEEKSELMTAAQARVIEHFLPILDHLNQAEVFIKDAGLKMVKDNFAKILEEIGVKEVPLLDKEYDPYTAEAIELVQGEKDNIVVEVLRKAYEFKGKVIRIGQVKVSKKISN